MAIYITGDTHGNFNRIYDLCEKIDTTTDDTIIILGDVGINYYGGKRDKKTKEKLSKLPITIFAIKGNHEEYAGDLQNYTEDEYWGSPVFIESEYPNLVFAKDGEIYNLPFEDGTREAIVIGGAYSVDKFYRLARGFKWFKNEQPSEETKAYVEKQLDKVNWRVDYVLSHTCPLKYEPIEWFLPMVDQSTVDKGTEEWLDTIHDKINTDVWYCGHYHGEKRIDNMRFLFESVMQLV